MFGLFQKSFAPLVMRIGARHADECAALHAASFTFAWRQEDIEALLTSSSTYADGTFGKAGELQGFILSRKAADEAEILTIAVTPRLRGKGLASALMKANMAQLQKAGVKSWFLEVEAQNSAALALYKRFGFEQVGERKSYYKKSDGDAALAYILRRGLR